MHKNFSLPFFLYIKLEIQKKLNVDWKQINKWTFTSGSQKET